MTSPTRVIVTGAAQGIGRAVALRVAAADVQVAVWDTQADGVEETAKLCRERGATSRAWLVDVGDAAAVEAAVAAFEREWGRPDALVNNAAIFPRARALDMELAEWERVLRVNLTGTFVCAQAAARRMKEVGRGVIVNMASGRALAGAVNGAHYAATKGGVIVNMASGRALAGAANGAHYAATKGGVIALTKSLALDWAPYGIRVNCVIPGITDTAQPRGEMSDEQLYAMGARIPLGRIGEPQDIAAAVAFLLGDDSAYMTGQSIAVNGGAIMIP